ncbi:MAG: diguanylate cyclase [Clostridia bacterium]|nr:diguanylate cyclase [Clostridia bacterium]
MKNVNRRTTLMQLQVSLPVKIVSTFAIMAILILIVYFFKIPNPNMILIAGLVLCSALFGFGGGITAGIIMFFYTLYFFSTDNDFIHFTSQNTQKVIVSLAGILADLLLVCFLKRAEVKAFVEVDELTEKLHKENERLQSISLTDALTGIQNRMALRQGYDSYQNNEVTVIMLDIDKFKMINDTYGHEEGDRVLRETGILLADAFGRDNCYRYGGDEFLIICPRLSDDELEGKLELINETSPVIKADDSDASVEFSYGLAHGPVVDNTSLRTLFSMADERMYDVKNGKSKTE